MPAGTWRAPSLEPASREQRLLQGRARRKQLSRSELGQLDARKRGFDPIKTLLQSDANRLPKLLPLKYARMSASPFAFFRGAVSIMAADLAGQAHSGLYVQMCGDAHLENLGSFEAPDGRLVFDIDDFDETIPGPWEWDVKRMAVSIVLAGRESGHRRSGCVEAVAAFAASYCMLVETLADLPVLVAARHKIHRAKKAQAVSAALEQAERASPTDLLAKYTERRARGQVRFKPVEHVLWRLGGKQRQQVLAGVAGYVRSLPPERLHLFEFFRPLDAGFKVVGTGSVGLRDYVVLMEGNGPGDPLFLQMKEEQPSAYAPYLRHHAWRNQGQRVAVGQHRIQPVSDLLLGWTRIGKQDYLVRQLNDHKGRVSVDQLREDGLRSLADVAGELLARGHARSGDALMIKGYIGAPERLVASIVRYALDYAERVEADFVEFTKAIEGGRLKTAA